MSAVSLQAVKDHIGEKNVQRDDELQGFIDAAESLLATRIGPLEPTTFTERVSGRSALVLAHAPVISLTSLTPHVGDALTVEDLYLDAGAGIVYYADSRVFTTQPHTVVYVAGRETLPAHLALAVKELVRHLWKTQRGAMPSIPGQDLDPFGEGAGTLPHRVLELIARDELPPSVA